MTAPRRAPLTVLVGRTREDRRVALASVATLDAHRRPDFLYLTATRRKADLVRASFWDQPDKPATFLPTVVPWGRFRDELIPRWGDGRVPLPPVARELFAGRLFAALRPQWKVWSGLEDGPTVRRALADLAEGWGLGFATSREPELSEDPSAFVFPGEATATWGPLFASSRSLGPELREDAGRWVGAWRAALARSDLVTDVPTALRAVLRAVEEGSGTARKGLRAWRALIVDDLLWLPPLELALLAGLVAAYREANPDGAVFLCLEAAVGGSVEAARRLLGPGDDAPADQRATGALRVGWGRAARDGALRVVDAEPEVEDLADLVARDAILAVGHPGFGQVRVHGLGSVRAEVAAIARAIKAELLAGRRPGDMGVSFPDLNRYGPEVRDVFAAYGIPFVVEKGEDLLDSPPCSAARQLLRLVVEGATPERLRSALASGWVRAWMPVEPELVDPVIAGVAPLLGARTARVAAEARDRIEDQVAVRPSMERLHRALSASGAGGARPSDWLTELVPWRIRAAEDRLRRVGEDAERRAALETTLVAALARDVVEIVALERLMAALAPVAEARTPAEVAARFLELLETVGIRPEEPRPEFDPVRAQAVRANAAAIGELRAAIQSLVASLAGIDALAPPPRTERSAAAVVGEALDETIRSATYRADGPIDGVSVAGLRDLHGADLPWLWVGGLVEGAFPRPTPPSFLLPALVPPLIPAVARADEDRAVFASILRNAGHGARRSDAVVTLSWPRSDGARDALPSSPLADLLALRCAEGGTLGDRWRREQRVREAGLPPLLSRDELLTQGELCRALLEREPRLDAEQPVLLAAADVASMRRWDEVVSQRSRDDGFGGWDGVLALGRPHRAWALQTLGVRLGIGLARDGRRRLSLRTTGLEAWSKCPAKFFYEHVLGLEEPRPFSAEPGPDETGTLTHQVLERFVGERIEAQRQGRLESAALYTLGPAEQVEASRRLREIALVVAEERLGHRRGPWSRRVVADLVAGLEPPAGPAWQGPLARFLAEEFDSSWLDAEPARVEHAFEGLSPARAAERMTPADEGAAAFRFGTGDLDVRLRGTIDRVDLPPQRGARHRVGSAGERVVVYDYKTGQTPSMDGVDEGSQFQAAVYPLAIEVPRWASGLASGYWELGEAPGRQRRRMALASRLWRAVEVNPDLPKPAGFKKTTLPTTMWAWRAWLMRADWYGQLIGAGVFPPTLRSAAFAGCGQCAFRRACRTDPERTERILHPLAPEGAGAVPVFWPRPVSVQRELDLMFGPRPVRPDALTGAGKARPDEEPPRSSLEGDGVAGPSAARPAHDPGPVPPAGPLPADVWDGQFEEDPF